MLPSLKWQKMVNYHSVEWKDLKVHLKWKRFHPFGYIFDCNVAYWMIHALQKRQTTDCSHESRKHSQKLDLDCKAVWLWLDQISHFKERKNCSSSMNPVIDPACQWKAGLILFFQRTVAHHSWGLFKYEMIPLSSSSVAKVWSEAWRSQTNLKIYYLSHF